MCWLILNVVEQMYDVLANSNVVEQMYDVLAGTKGNKRDYHLQGHIENHKCLGDIKTSPL